MFARLFGKSKKNEDLVKDSIRDLFSQFPEELRELTTNKEGNIIIPLSQFPQDRQQALEKALNPLTIDKPSFMAIFMWSGDGEIQIGASHTSGKEYIKALLSDFNEIKVEYRQHIADTLNANASSADVNKITLGYLFDEDGMGPKKK